MKNGRRAQGLTTAAPESERRLELKREDRVMVIAPHPDDEVLAAGGLILEARAAGAEVRVVYLTHGENNPWAQLAHEGVWPILARDRARWAARRKQEALAGLECLGLSASETRFLGLPDQGLSALFMRCDRRPALALSAELEAWRPTVIVAPALSDPHPDHSAAAITLELESERRSPSIAPCRLYYSSTLKRQRARSWIDRIIPLSRAALECKRRAILCHVSQLHWHRARFLAVIGEPEVFTLSPDSPSEDPIQPLTGAVLNGELLRVWIESGLRPGLNPSVLWVAFENHDGTSVRLTVRLSLARTRARIWDERCGQTIGHAGLRRISRGMRLDLPLGPWCRPRLGFVKLDHPFTRRLGFIYGAGWRQVTLAPALPTLSPRRVPAGSAVRVPAGDR